MNRIDREPFDIEAFMASIQVDCRMYRQDIFGSKAHARMLGRQGILTEEEARQIIAGLDTILHDLEAGNLVLDISAEDIHMNIEQELTRRIGSVGKKLHTGRSRNDQVALDCRLYTRDALDEISEALAQLMRTLMGLARDHLSTVMPGYTHLQKAQPVTLAHHLMAYVCMLERDLSRLMDCRKRVNVLPLGSGALATTTYPLDREYVAQLLGFDGITMNSMDAVSDRDFVLETTSMCAMAMMHLSRLCEEIILWSSDEFRFVKLPAPFATGSSIMPQKKNPDCAELIRGKAARVYGAVTMQFTLMKGLPLAYNKDMQEDKEQLFDTLDTLLDSLKAFAMMLQAAQFNKDAMEQGAGGGFTNATDAADYLVRKGMPFRDAHGVIRRMVDDCIAKGIGLTDLTLEQLQAYSPLFDADAYEAIALITCVDARKLPGGPAREQVLASIEWAEQRLAQYLL